MSPARPAAIWKRVLAAILDFFTVFGVGGWLVGKAAGETTPNGFVLLGAPALALLALIVIYFFAGRRILGGTVWDRILGIARPQPY